MGLETSVPEVKFAIRAASMLRLSHPKDGIVSSMHHGNITKGLTFRFKLRNLKIF